MIVILLYVFWTFFLASIVFVAWTWRHGASIRRIRRRSAPSVEEWMRRTGYDKTPALQKAAKDVTTAVSTILVVAPTQLQPDDKLCDLSDVPTWVSNDVVIAIVDAVQELVERQCGMANDPVQQWLTLDDMITYVADQRSNFAVSRHSAG